MQRLHPKRIETVPQILTQSANGLQYQANVLHIELSLGYRYGFFSKRLNGFVSHLKVGISNGNGRFVEAFGSVLIPTGFAKLKPTTYLVVEQLEFI